jgi:hypothetical protein
MGSREAVLGRQACPLLFIAELLLAFQSNTNKNIHLAEVEDEQASFVWRGTFEKQRQYLATIIDPVIFSRTTALSNLCEGGIVAHSLKTQLPSQRDGFKELYKLSIAFEAEGDFCLDAKQRYWDEFARIAARFNIDLDQ